MDKANQIMKFMKRKKQQKINYSIYIDQKYIELQTGLKFANKDEALHYFLMDGWPSRVDPCAVFSVDFYLSENPDVKATNINPLEHFIKFGYKEGRSPHFLFDPLYYLKKLGLENDVNALEHYITSSKRGSPSPYFNEYFYRANHLVDAGISGLEHFVKKGGKGKTHPLIGYLEILSERKTGEEFSPYNYFTYTGTNLFSPDFYDESIPGARAIGLLRHFCLFGKNEGRFTEKNVFASLAEKTVEYDKNVYDSAIESMADSLSFNSKDSTASQFSIVIVNWNKSSMTIQCVAQILENTSTPFEIIVVDNGSEESEYAKLTSLRSLQNLRIVRLEVNRYFGEANNIGVEEARSDLICFLNNDAFVTKGWEKPLLNAITVENYHASSPKFLFPDGRLQEAGGQINSCGQNVQFGKGLDPNENQFNFDMDVSHASAACLFMKKHTFARLGGFDLRYEPAYYEDADLSAKLKAIGGCIRYKPDSVVYHVENATSKDPRIGFDFGSLVGTNRIKFVERWGEFLRGNGKVEIPDNSSYILESPFLEKPKEEDKIAVVYSPYDLTPGGGERYILSLAATLTQKYITYFVTPSRYSYFRLAAMGEALGVDVTRIRLLEFRRLNKLPHVDVFVAMSNELSPAVRAIGREKNIYHCQFPFPMSSWHVTNCLENVEEYDMVIVNSEFTRQHYIREAEKYAVNIPEVEIVSPPVETNKVPIKKDWDSDVIEIINVGRYIAGGHCKKQFELIEAFRYLLNEALTLGLEKSFRLSFVGSLSSSQQDREYFAKLKEAAKGLPIDFYVNAPIDRLRDLYRRAHFYWHGTGINESVENNPEVFEHFGITPVEAMSYGAIPVVWKEGGPAEVISDFSSSIAVDIREYASSTLDILENKRFISEKMFSLAKKFDVQHFCDRVQSIIFND